MDPHATRDYYENLSQTSFTHRRLKQSLSPPSSSQPKKKKLVNFKLSRRKRSVDEYAPTNYRSAPDSNGNSPIIHEEVEEDLLRECEDAINCNGPTLNNSRNYGNATNLNFSNLNGIRPPKTRGDSSSSISTADTTATMDSNSKIQSCWPQIPDNYRTSFNQVGQAPNQKTQAPTDYIPMKTRKPSINSRWNTVKLKTSEESLRSNSLFSVVNTAVTVNKKRSTAPPSIWTPAVPRSQPAPRPGNWREQEEPGSGSYRISFVSNAMLAKTKQQIKQMKFVSSPYYQESQSPRQRKKHVEYYGRQYVPWISDVLKHPSFEDGQLLKAMEVGGQFPVIHLQHVPKNYRKRHDSSSSMTHFGLGSDAVLNEGIYEEVVSWVPELLVTCPSDPSQWARCFIVIGFMTLDGELSPVEDQWREWTGSLFVYFNISDDLHLKKLSFFRRTSRHHTSLFTYIVLIEVDTVTKENCLYLLDFVYRMRMKGMGGHLCVYQEHIPSSSKDSKDRLDESPSRVLESSILDMKNINI